MSRATDGDFVIDFAESLCRQTEGQHAGRLLTLAPWQKTLLRDLFVLRPDGRRQYRKALIGMPRKNGKGLSVDETILTDNGWKRFGDLQPGDCVHTIDGTLTPVVAVSAIRQLECYRFEFADGQSIVCDADHQWTVWDRWGHDPSRWQDGRRKGAWRTLPAPRIAATYRCGVRGDTRYSVQMDRVLDRPPAALPIPPYVLGAWLGDGNSASARLTCGYADSQILDEIRWEGITATERVSSNVASGIYRLGGTSRSARVADGTPSVQSLLRGLGVLGNKHIPESYLLASADQRMALLRGLMDTDGAVNRGPNTPRVEFTSTRYALAEGVLFLARSLGWKATLSESRATLDGRDCGPRWRVTWTAYADRSPFRLARKSAALAPPPCRPTRAATNPIVTVERVSSVPTRCIQVAHPSGQFLVGSGLIPTHNSSLAGVLALYLLLMDGEPGAQVYSCAGDKDQAKIVFKAARRMVELEPELSACLKLYRDAIEHPGSGSVYRAVSAEAYTKEGLNPSGVIFDELHVQPNRELWDVMTLGSGTRQQPLVVAITTAGYDKDTICGELYDYGKKVSTGEIADDRFFFRWWEPAAANCDYRDRAVWAEANPALGDFLHVEDLEDALQKPENVFRRYRLNQWTSTAEAWLPHGAWDACRAPELDLDPRLPLHVGIDVALRNDSTAVVAAQKQGERTVVRARIWENPYPLDDHRHGDWTLNIFEVEEWLKGLFLGFPVPACAIDGEVKPGPEFAYDPAFFGRSAQVLEGEGLAMVEFPQHDSRMVPACQNLYQLVVEGTLAHDGDPALARHVANAAADQRPRGWRLTKKQSKRKIDAAIATAIAALRAQEPAPETPASVYEERGILSL